MADDPHAAARALLDERPETEPALETLLAVERDADDAWSFDDADVDSGTFGELVSRGIVERVDDATAPGDYRLADPDAVRAALDGDAYADDAETSGDYRLVDPDAVRAALDGESYAGDEVRGDAGRSVGLPDDLGAALRARIATPSSTFLGALLGALAFLFVFRTVTYRSVFREELIALPGNDPYMYRYQVDRLLAAEPDPLDFPAIGEALGGRATGEPFVHTLGYWATTTIESNPEQAGVAIAWLPVLAALAVGVLVAWTALAVTEDERVAVLAVLALALTPAHALYSGIGFFDHHAFDYVWLAGMAAALVWLARDLERRTGRAGDGERHAGDDASATPVRDHLLSPWTWVVASAFGLVVTLAVFTWNGAPVLLTGVAAYVFFRAGSDLRAGHSPVGTAAPVAAGLALAGGLSYAIHSWAGWQEPAVVYSPLLVLGGLVVVTTIAEGCRHVDAISPRAYMSGTLVGTGGLLFGVWYLTPDVLERLLLERAGSILFGRRREYIAESRSLLATDFGVILGSLDMFGWFLFIAVPVLGWISWRCLRAHEPRWLVLCGFAWSLLVFAVFEIRFSGELSPFAAVFVAVGAIGLLSRIDLVAPMSVVGDRTPRRLRRESIRPSTESVYLVGMLLLLASLSLFLVPAVMGTVAHEDGTVEAAAWMAENAETTEREEYVSSAWGDQRFYNYHVFGVSDSYVVAIQDDIEALFASPDPDAEYERFDSGMGYLVLETVDDFEAGPESGYVRLVENYGAADGDVDGVAHYRVEFVSTDREYVVVTPVPGATIEGIVDGEEELAEERFTIETDVDAGGVEFTYTRHVEPDDEGAFAVTVAQPGTYDIDGEEVTVTEADVREGNVIETET